MSAKASKGRAGRAAAKAAEDAAVTTEAPSGEKTPDDKVTKRWSRRERREERRSKKSSMRGGDGGDEAERGAEDGDVVEEVPEEKPLLIQEDLDILRTARISKQSNALDVTHPYPEVKLTPYGENWATDSFALIHNAVKAELRDMYQMAIVMQRRKMQLTLRHIDVFYEWWEDFKEFVSTALDIEEEVLFKWIGSKEYLRGSFKKSERMRVNGAMRKVMDSVMEYKDKFLPYLPVGERLEGLMQLLDGFIEVLDHYDQIARQLPSYIELLFKQKEKEANAKEVVATFRMQDGYNRNLVLLSRWMPERMMKRWAFSNLKSKDLIAFRGWRNMIGREHCLLAMKFDDIVMEEEEASLGAPVIGAAMAINEDMREHIDNNRASVRSLPKSAFT